MINDVIADSLMRIKNGYLASKKEVVIPYSRLRQQLVKLIIKAGFLSSVKIKGEKTKKQLVVELKYVDKKPVLTQVVKLSKPSLRMYVKHNQIPKVLGGLGVVILSTSSGLMLGKEARKKKVGGELICKIW